MTASTLGWLARAAERQPTATAIGQYGRSLRRHRLHCSPSLPSIYYANQIFMCEWRSPARAYVVGLQWPLVRMHNRRNWLMP